MLHLNYGSLKASSGLLSPAMCAEAPSRGLHRTTATVKNGEETGGRDRKHKAEPLLHHVERRTNQTQSAPRAGSERERESYVVTDHVMLPKHVNTGQWLITRSHNF